MRGLSWVGATRRALSTLAFPIALKSLIDQGVAAADPVQRVMALRGHFLALFGVLTAVLGVKEQSLAEGGAMMDGWITSGVDTVRGVLPGGAEAAAAADVAEPAAGTAGPAAEAVAAAASDGTKKE
jgi:hypothetical protein